MAGRDGRGPLRWSSLGSRNRTGPTRTVGPVTFGSLLRSAPSRASTLTVTGRVLVSQRPGRRPGPVSPAVAELTKVGTGTVVFPETTRSTAGGRSSPRAPCRSGSAGASASDGARPSGSRSQRTYGIDPVHMTFLVRRPRRLSLARPAVMSPSATRSWPSRPSGPDGCGESERDRHPGCIRRPVPPTRATNTDAVVYEVAFDRRTGEHETSRS